MKREKLTGLALFAAVLLFLLTACGGAQQAAPTDDTEVVSDTSAPTDDTETPVDDTEVTPVDDTETAAHIPARSTGGTLMEDNVNAVDEDNTVFPVFGSPMLARIEVRSITFLSDASDAPADSWDVSQKQDGSVIAWAVEDGDSESPVYDLFIASDGGVIAPENCAGMFSDYENAESIVFSSNFDTSHVTDMSSMFSGCTNLTTLDLSGFDTSHVTNMSEMFSNCENLTAVDVSAFDTSHVTNMEDMFAYCENLTTLDVSGFDTSSVEYMRHMFIYCESLEKLDVSGFDTSNVKEAGGMFWACPGVKLKDTSGFDLSNVTDIDDPRYIFLTSKFYDMVDELE